MSEGKNTHVVSHICAKKEFPTTCRPCRTLATGLPSFSHVKLGKGTPVASHSNLAGSFTKTVTVPPGLEMTGGTAGNEPVLPASSVRSEFRIDQHQHTEDCYSLCT